MLVCVVFKVVKTYILKNVGLRQVILFTTYLIILFYFIEIFTMKPLLQNCCRGNMKLKSGILST